MSSVEAPLPSPGVGARRKGLKTLPRLPLSVFTSPPNSGTSEQFPLPPSPSSVHPSLVVDSNVLVKGDSLHRWTTEVTNVLSGKADGIVAILSSADDIQTLPPKQSVIAVSVPIALENGKPATVPTFPSSPRVHFSTVLTGSSQNLAEGLAWALQSGRVVDVDVQTNVVESEAGWEALEDLLEKTTEKLKDRTKGVIVLSNVLPPPHSLDLPIVKLLTHPSYIAYQSHISSISLYANVCVKFLPPAWGTPVPHVTLSDASSKEAKEWKRRIKMFLGPVVEAFGYQRILFGSSSSSNAADWYELARESFAELGLEQEDIDNVFGNNAKRIYSS